MIDNPTSVVAAFVSLVETALGAATLWMGAAALRRLRGAGADSADAVEDRFHLLVLCALTLAGLSLVAWPLVYLTLASYVPQWPGVMCIQGVTRVGAGSIGPARWLPGLLTTLQVLRPLIVFVAGAWITLHIANRRTRTAPLTRGVLACLTAAGAIALVAGSVELAYLFIPKEEQFLSTGCCTVPPQLAAGDAAFRPFLAWFGERYESAGVAGLFFGGGLFLAIGITAILVVRTFALRRGPLLLLALAAALHLYVAAGYANEVASPVVLRLPNHFCAWCLLAFAPESALGAFLVATAAFSIGWALVAACGLHATPDGDESRPAGARQVRKLLLVALSAIVLALAFAAALPVVSGARHGHADERCALDGVAIDDRHAVRIVDVRASEGRRFCCTTCAASWLAWESRFFPEPVPGREVFVVDEETGAEIPAAKAWFVRSLVTAVRATGNRVHVFATEAAARRHAEEFHGTLLVGDDRPLANPD